MEATAARREVRRRLMAEAVGRPWARLLMAGVVATGAARIALAHAGWPWLLTYNSHASVPVGWYRWAPRTPVAKGTMVQARPDPRHWALGWVLKRVVGAEGDTYCWDPALGTQRLDGAPMPPPHPVAVQVLHVPPWRGCVTLGPGQFVLYGDSEDSFDSRYMGVADRDVIWGVYVPVFR